MDREYLRGVVKYAVTVLIAIVLIAYLLYHISGGFQVDISTSAAILTNQERTLTATAYIFRDENVIFSSERGDISYLYADGEKVAINTTVAQVYSSSLLSSESRQRIVDIDRMIRLLEASNMSSSERHSDTSSTDILIRKNLYSYIDSSNGGNISAAKSVADELLVQLNRRRIIIGNVKNYDKQIADLKTERSRLYGTRQDAHTEIITDSPGYFWSGVDGYEGILSGSITEKLNFSSFKEIISRPAIDYSQSGQYPIGKLVTDYEWYIACEVSREELHNYQTGNNYGVRFPMSGNVSVNMKLYRILTDINSDTAVLIFRTGEQPENFRYLRTQTVQIVEQTHSGYRIPVSSLRIRNGVPGVYILSGSEIKFRKVEILYEYDVYFVVSEQSAHPDDKSEWLAKYDNVIVEGKNLYDGRIIN